MSLEKIRWRCKAQKKIKDGVWYYPFLYEVDVFENCVIQGFNNPITFPRRKKKIRYKMSCSTFGKIEGDYERCLKKTETFLSDCKNLGAIVTTLTFDQFYSFWSINPYRWHCRDLFAIPKMKTARRYSCSLKPRQICIPI